jgi:ABC-type nickel/cobalt efflux system permease component RcnA
MKRLSRLTYAVLAAGGVYLPVTAWAHLVNTNVGEFYAGMMHPLTSSEHLLPTLALALMAGQCGKHAARAALLAFPAALLAGTISGSLLPPYDFFQVINLILLVVLGGLLAFTHRLSRITTMPMTMLALLTGLILGYRSGMDMAAAKVAVQFIPGVALTGLILVALIAAWVPVVSSRMGQALIRMAGTGFALVGMVLLIQLFTGTGPLSARLARMPGQEDLLAMLRSGELGAAFIAGTLLAAMAWGAGHALTPGHGKAIVGAYLIGARSTPWHAVYLGLTVTLTHTLGVLALGLVALFASRYVLPEQLYPWLAAASGLIVVGMGLFMLRQRVRPLIAEYVARRRDHHDHEHNPGDHVHGHGHEHPHTHGDDGLGYHGHHHHDHVHGHDHEHPHPHDDSGHADHDHHHHHHDHHGHDHLHTNGHSHEHGHGHSHLPPGADGSPVTWRSLLLLGISGGLLPCPSALVLLLAAVSMNRAAFGMALVVAFSLGLAAVLTVVGLLFVKGSRIVQQVPRLTAWGRYLPVASALVITVLGVVLTAGAAMSLGD